FEAAYFFVNVDDPRVRANADGEPRPAANRIAADVQPEIQVVNDVHQTDGIDVKDRRGVRIVAELRRIAGDADQVVDPHRVTAQQLGLHAEHIAVATRKVQRGFDARLLLHKNAQCNIAQPG